MRRILLIATGGTIASRYTREGLSPRLTPEELLAQVPQAAGFCRVEATAPFNLDSTNVCQDQWLLLARLIEERYEAYDGFVICHGTDTMAYTAAALSYLIQNNRKPVVITGAQKPIDLPVTDARTNLLDSLRFAADERAHGVNIVFGGEVIAGTRAKKERTKSYNAFSSINFPPIAVIQENRIVFYIDDKDRICGPPRFYRGLNERVCLFKLIPGAGGAMLERLSQDCDGVIIESFGVGGLPDYGDGSFQRAIEKAVRAGKKVVMATQVTREGSDMAIYQVGQTIKQKFDLPESYDMTLEAAVAKTMWALGQTKDPETFRRLFYRTINHDLLFCPSEDGQGEMTGGRRREAE